MLTRTLEIHQSIGAEVVAWRNAYALRALTRHRFVAVDGGHAFDGQLLQVAPLRLVDVEANLLAATAQREHVHLNVRVDLPLQLVGRYLQERGEYTI